MPPNPRISVNQKFSSPILQAFNLEARSVFLSWRAGKYPLTTKFLLVKAEIEPLRFENVYEGFEPEKTICHGPDALTIDEIDIETKDETAVEKSIFHIIRAVTEGDTARVMSIFREFGKQISVETNDRSGRSILMIACQRGELDIVKTLLDRGANPRATTGSGKTPLSISVSEGYLLVVKSILQKDPTAISYIDMNGTTLLMIAVESVQSAIHKGHGIEIVKLLADHGVNVSFLDKNGFSALDRLCMSSGNVEAAKFLIELGCTPSDSVSRKSGMNQLMMAALNGHTELCKFFMDTHGLDPTVKTEHDGLAHLFAENAGFSKTAASVKKRYDEVIDRQRRERAENVHSDRRQSIVHTSA